MAREFEVKTRLTVADEASKGIAKIEKAFSGLSKTIADRFVITAGDAERAARLLVDVLVSSVDAAAQQESSVSSLVAALHNVAPGAEAGVGALLAFADAQQRVTKESDDAVIAAQALLTTFGVAPSKINDATLAALNLSAALGTDLRSAAAQVGATFNGVTRGLDKIVPGLKGLSDEALKTGAAVDLMNEALAGRAVAAADTFAGRSVLLANALGEVQEALGETIVQSDAIATSQEIAAEATFKYADVLRRMLPDLAAVVRANSEFAAVADAVKVAVAAVNPEVERYAELWRSVGLLVGGALDGLAAKFATHQDQVARTLRIEDEWSGTLDNLASVATRLGVSIDADLNAKLEANRIEVEFVNEAYASGILQVGEYQRIIAALAAEQATLRAALSGGTDELRRHTAAVDDAARAYGDLARAMVPVGAGGLTLAQNITFAGGGSIVSGSQLANGGGFGTGTSINAQSRLPPIRR